MKLVTELSYSKFLHFLKLSGKCHVSKLPKFTSHPYTTCFKAEMLYPKTPNSVSDTYENKVFGEMKINWSPSTDCQDNAYIKASLQAERSSKQLKEESDDYEFWQCRKSNSPVACQSYLNKAGQLKKYILNVDYKDVPVSVKNITMKLWRALKYKYFWQTDVAQIKVHNPEDKIKAIIRIDPFNDRRLNITVKTCKENVTMYDIPVPFHLRPLNLKRSIMNQMYEDVMFGKDAPVCEVSSDRVNTFDNAEFSFRMGNCWTVLAKDCSEERTFAILAKRMTGGDKDEKACKIVTPYGKVKLTKKPAEGLVLEKDGELVPITNGEPIEIIQHGHVIISCLAQDESYVKCWLPEQQVKVYFDGYNVNVKMDTPLYMGRQCGICGNLDFDPNPETEFYKLDSTQDWFEPEFNIRKAFHSYTIKDDQCSRPENYEEMCSSDMCEYEQTAFPEEYRRSRPYDLPDEFDYRSEIMPVHKTRRVERYGKLCFSKRPIPTCPEYTYPAEIKATEEVTFKCQPKYSTYWGSYEDSSSSSSSSSTEDKSDDRSRPRRQSRERLNADQSSSSDTDEQTTVNNINSHRRPVRVSRERSTERRRQTGANDQASSSSTSGEGSSESSSESRMFDSASQDVDVVGGEEIKISVQIPQTCRKL